MKSLIFFLGWYCALITGSLLTRLILPEAGNTVIYFTASAAGSLFLFTLLSISGDIRT
ncbi:MAG: hypothetical protein PHQ23_16015 [Candidatus Wallbacteria bacterium]|nr:hypothetical protein [Candidatus Wallbacteria bacterium]